MRAFTRVVPTLELPEPEHHLAIDLHVEGWEDELSLEVWARAHERPAGSDAPLLVATTADERRAFGVHLPASDGHLRWGIGESDSGALSRSLPAERERSWTHWAFVKRGPQLTVLVDGEPWHETSDAPALPPLHHLRVGADPAGSGGWVGELAELRLWRLALSEEDVRARMHQRCTGHEVGIVGYWRLDERRGDHLRDHSSYEQTAAVVGPRWQEASLPLAPPPPSATGLRNYSYWLRWKLRIAARARARAGTIFRRGLISS